MLPFSVEHVCWFCHCALVAHNIAVQLKGGLAAHLSAGGILRCFSLSGSQQVRDRCQHLSLFKALEAGSSTSLMQAPVNPSINTKVSAGTPHQIHSEAPEAGHGEQATLFPGTTSPVSPDPCTCSLLQSIMAREHRSGCHYSSWRTSREVSSCNNHHSQGNGQMVHTVFLAMVSRNDKSPQPWCSYRHERRGMTSKIHVHHFLPVSS